MTRASKDMPNLNYNALEQYGKYSLSVSHMTPSELSLVVLLGVAVTTCFVIGELHKIPALDIIGFVLVGIGSVKAHSYVAKRVAARELLLARFARDNSFQRGQVNIDHAPGSMFALGRHGSSFDAITGRLGQYPFKLLAYHYVTGSGKYQRDFDVSIMEVTLPHRFPQLVLDSLVEPGNGLGTASTLPIFYKPSQRIELEGDFSRYYDVYAPKGHEENTLVLLTPDVMAALLESATGCDMEIVDDKLYFYWPRSEDKQADFRAHFETTIAVLGAMSREVNSKAAAVKPSDARVLVAPGNHTHLQKTKWAFSPVGLAGIAFGVYLLGNFLFIGNYKAQTAYDSKASIVIIFIVIGILVYPKFRQNSKSQRRKGDWGDDHGEPSDDEWLKP